MAARTCVAPAFLLLIGGCSTFSHVVSEIDQESPPQELGRPGWVRYSARTGAWLGGFVGALGSIITLPITFPISLLADEPLGMAKDEFLFWGVSAGAASGHFLIGAPTDFLDFTFRRAWQGEPPQPDFSTTPPEATVPPKAPDEPATEQKSPPD